MEGELKPLEVLYKVSKNSLKISEMNIWLLVTDMCYNLLGTIFSFGLIHGVLSIYNTNVLLVGTETKKGFFLY